MLHVAHCGGGFSFVKEKKSLLPWKGREAFKGGRGRERERGSKVKGERREEGGLKGVEGMKTRMQPAAAFRRSRCLSLPPLLLLLLQQAEAAAAAAGCGIRLNRFWVLDHLKYCPTVGHSTNMHIHHCHSVTLSTVFFNLFCLPLFGNKPIISVQSPGNPLRAVCGVSSPTLLGNRQDPLPHPSLAACCCFVLVFCIFI